MDSFGPNAVNNWRIVVCTSAWARPIELARGISACSAFCTVLFVAAVGAGVTALKPAAVLARTAKPASVVVCVVNGAVKPGTSSEACPALTPR